MIIKKIALVGIFFFLVNSCFAQTNAMISFIVTVDTSAPEFYYFGSNSSTVSGLNQSVLLSAYWEDTYEGLDSYQLETNSSGVFENSTAYAFDEGWSNTTNTFSNASQEGGSVYFQYHGVDLNNNWNSTGFKSVELISEAPEYFNVTQNTSNPTAGELVLISSYWTDNFNIYNTTLQINHTGIWSNNQTIYHNKISTWANYTFNTTGYSGESVWWRVRAYDNATIVNYNTTKEFKFDVI